MKKVVFICEALGGGVRRHLVDVLSNLDLDEYEVHVVHGTKRVDDVFLSAKNKLIKKGLYFYEVTEMVRELSIKNDIRATKSIIKILREVRPQIVHCHSSKAGAIGRIAAKICGIKRVYYTPHAYVFQNPNLSSKKKFVYKNIEKLLGFLTTKVLHVSKGEETFALEHKVISLNKSMVVYNGISFPATDSKFPLKDCEEKLVVGTIARMDYQKNPWLFIRMAEQVIRENQNVEFVYIGDGEYFKEVFDYVQKNNLDKFIKLKGFHSNPDIELNRFDIFLSTSLYEGMPYSLIEALSYKKPIIATDVVGNNEIVLDDYNGYLFDKDNAEEGTQKILEIIKDPILYDKLSKNSLRTFEETFTIEKMLSSIEELYSK
ncbi:glycosyltransferase family 4 protein [Bacillus cereus]|uniref:glycosyltransferase family 4 protein n=1 Tax=Bacillus cereus TaxID=1396 RepID=UPI0032F7EA55|nr:glycosyltransferase family 4 protein [Bacillus cereus]